MKKVLVTGGAGFIGTNLIKRLKKEGFKITSIDNYTTGLKENEINSVQYINSDIEEINQIDNINFDYCFHLAAQSRVQPSFDNPEEAIRTNVIGTQKVIEWAMKKNIKVIYAGSSSKHYDPSDSPYASSKYMGEQICKLYRKSFNVNVEIARFYNVYGPYESVHEKFGNVIGIWQSQIKKQKPLTIVGDGNQKRDFTHVKDIVDALILLAKNNESHPDAWEIGSGINYSVNDVFKMFKAKFNVSSINIDDQPGNYRETLRVNDDLITKLNWQPKDRLKDHINNLNL